MLHFGPFLSIKEDLAHLKLKSSICRHFVLHSCTPICTKCQEYSLGLLKLPHNTLQSQLQSPYPVIMMRDLTRLAIEMTPNAHRKATIAELSHTCHAFRDRNRSLKSLGEHFPAELLEIITRAWEDFYGLFIVESRFRVSTRYTSRRCLEQMVQGESLIISSAKVSLFHNQNVGS